MNQYFIFVDYVCNADNGHNSNITAFGNNLGYFSFICAIDTSLATGNLS